MMQELDFGFFFQLGWSHIVSLDALDHQLFILALVAVYTLKEFKQVLILVTAFTIGHSLTLALSALNVVSFESGWVEFLIPCTIVATALFNLFKKDFSNKVITINYYLALVFGLIHGLGFANAVRMMLPKGEGMISSLLAFNIGLEAGQLLFVGVILALALFALSTFKINRREWVIFLSAVVFGLSLKMMLERIPF